jgi:hemolysin activation/secretion protein
MSMRIGIGAPMRHGRLLSMMIGSALALPFAAHAQTQAAAAAPAPAATPASFQINEYLVRGNTLLGNVDIEESVEPYLGPGRSMKDVHAAQGALQKLYQSKGYQSVVVEVPPQQVKNGVILLQVVENSIGRVRVEGAKYHSPQEIRDAVPALAEGTIPNFTQAQQQLADVNREQPGRQVVPLLSPGSMPDTMDVTLKVDDSDPWHGSVEVNNDHSADTPDLRTIANVSYNNLWQLGQTLSASYIVAPQDPRATEVYALSYLAPLSADWSLLGSAYKSNSNANTLGGTTVLGKGNAFSFQATRQLPVLGDYTQMVSFGFSRKHFDQNITLGGQTTEAPLTYYPLTAAYTGQRVTDASTSSFTLTGNFGLRGVGSSNTAFDDQRYNARDNFADLHLDFNYVHNLVDGFALATRASAQATDEPLVSSEQFAAGGMSSVRGYLSAEDTADNGAIASVEVRTPSVNAWLGSWANDWRFHVFVDSARLMLIDPLPDQNGRFTLLSTGVGTQFTVFHYLTGDLEYAYPLRNGVETKAHDGHLLFSVKAGL